MTKKISLKNKEKRTIEVMGVSIPYWQDCKTCSAKLACGFDKFTYSQPCNDCKSTEKYQKEHGNPKERSMQDMMDSNKVASVFEGHGRMYYVNKHGNVLKDEPARPLPTGRKDWK